MAEYLAVAAARPNLPDVHFWLGHLYWKHGDADHAFAELTRQLELDPGHPEANGELGAVLVAEDRPAEAIPAIFSRQSAANPIFGLPTSNWAVPTRRRTTPALKRC